MKNTNDATSLLLTARPLESYDFIELSEAEMHEALRKGRKEKYHQLKLEEYKRSLQVVHRPVQMDAPALRSYIAEQFPHINTALQPAQYEQLIAYFTGSEQRGLLLFGGVGCGKTTLMRIFQANPKASYAVKSCSEIAKVFSSKDGGYDAIRPYYEAAHGQRNAFNHTEYGICLDDLGEEKDKRYYGNEANVIEEILLARYERRHLWHRTHVTTNLTADQIEEKYGSRVRSRMREMFLHVDFSEVADLRR